MDFDLITRANPAETQGRWVTWEADPQPDHKKKLRLLIAAAGNRAARDKIGAIHKAATTAAAGADLVQDQVTEVALRSLPGTVLLGWENLTKGGMPMPYSDQEAERILLSDRQVCRAIRDFILGQAQSLSNFLDKEEAAEEAAVKSVPAPQPAPGPAH